MNDDRSGFQFLSVLTAMMWLGALVLFQWTRLDWRTHSSDAPISLLILIAYLSITLFFTSLTVRAYKKLHDSENK